MKFEGLGVPADEPARMFLVHPISRQPLRDKEGKDSYIDLLSIDSEAARDHDRSVMDRRFAMRARQKIKGRDVENELVEKYAAVTKGWYLVAWKTGEPLDIPCTPANAREIYGHNTCAWIVEQITEWIGDRANFTKA